MNYFVTFATAIYVTNYVAIILQTNKTNKTYNERYLLYRTYYKR